jgi:hypothetical protein
MKKNNDKVKPLLRIRYGASLVSVGRSHIDGEGLFALCVFKPDEIICISNGYIVDSKIINLKEIESRISYQLDTNHHFVPTEIVGTKINGLATVNHSCRPNAYVKFDDQRKSLELKALRSISKDEEITCDYCTTEVELTHPFLCRCGMENCYGLIRGKRYLR